MRVRAGEALEHSYQLVGEGRVPLGHFWRLLDTELVELEHREGVQEELTQHDAEDGAEDDADHLVAELDRPIGAEAPAGRAILLHVDTHGAGHQQHRGAEQANPDVLQPDSTHQEDTDDECRRHRIAVRDADGDAVDEQEQHRQAERKQQHDDGKIEPLRTDEQDSRAPTDDPQPETDLVGGLPVRCGCDGRATVLGDGFVHDLGDVDDGGTEDHPESDDEEDLAVRIFQPDVASRPEPWQQRLTHGGSDVARHGNPRTDQQASTDGRDRQAKATEPTEGVDTIAEHTTDQSTGTELGHRLPQKLRIGQGRQNVRDRVPRGERQLHPVDDDGGVEHPHTDAEHPDAADVRHQRQVVELRETEPGTGLQQHAQRADAGDRGRRGLHVVAAMLALRAVRKGDDAADDTGEHLHPHRKADGEQHESPHDSPKRTEQEDRDENQQQIVLPAVERRVPLDEVHETSFAEARMKGTVHSKYAHFRMTRARKSPTCRITLSNLLLVVNHTPHDIDAT